MSSFVKEALLCAKAAERLDALRYAPSTWTKENKIRWLGLPPDLQAYTVARDKERDREMHRSHREAGDLRRALAAAELKIAELEAKLKESDVRPPSKDEIAAKTQQLKETYRGDTEQKPTA